MYATDIGDREKRHGNRRPDVDALRCPRRQRKREEWVVVDLPGKDAVIAGCLGRGRGGGGRLEPTQRGVDQHQEVCARPRAMTSARRSATWSVPSRHVSAM